MWQSDKKSAVALTFDFDGRSVWTSFGLTTPMPLSRGDYGANVGVPRILGLLKQFNIPATFFIPADTIFRYPDTVKQIHDEGHEIGHHGNLHESPGNLGIEDERNMIEIGMEAIYKVTGSNPSGYRSPSWDLSDNTIPLLKEYGFCWDSSLMGNDFELYRIGESTTDGGIVEVPVSYELDDAAYFMFMFQPVYLTGLASPDKVFEIWSAEFEGAYESNGAFILTMHPQFIGRWHRMKMLEKLIHHISGHPSVRFTTCSEMVSDWIQ
jgi:peptidoglycan-N-acetylglucosamine deacetylase